MRTSSEIKDEILKLVVEYHKSIPAAKRNFLPYSGRVYDEKELLNLVDSSLEFWLTAGRYTEAFEKAFSDRINVNHSYFVNSGSSANLLAVSALLSQKLGPDRLVPGDEVITVACCFPTTVAPIVQNGLIPVFVDIDLKTANIDVKQLEAVVTSRTRAVVLAHTLGNPFDISALTRFCSKYDLWLIEDNCDALGSTYNGKPTGSFGHISTSSFYPPHMITTGEGGMVSTSSPKLGSIIRSLRDWGRDCSCNPGQDDRCRKRFSGQYGDLPAGYDHKYVYSHLGYNLKATDMQAAIGLAQLGKLDSFITARIRNYDLLYKGLNSIPGMMIVEALQESSPSWFGFLMVLDSPELRDKMSLYLEDAGIQTRMLFSGNIVKQPCMSGLINGYHYRVPFDLDMTDAMMSRGLWVGVYPGLSENDIEYMIDVIRRFFH